MQRLKCHQVQGLGILSGALFVDPKQRRGPRDSNYGDHNGHVEAHESIRSVEGGQIYQDKLWSAIESVFSCLGQAGEDISLPHWG